MDLIREVNYGQAYSFKYSTRPGTPAAEKAQVDEAVKIERLAALQALLSTQQRQVQESMVGRDVKVLFEKAGREAGQFIGKSDYLHAVYADADPSVLGKVLPVRITASSANSLAGVLRS